MATPTDEIIEAMPEPSEFADQIESPVEATAESSSNEGVESPEFSFDGTPSTEETTVESPPSFDGEVFDPDIHCAGPDGKGIITKAGKYRRKRGKAKAVSYVANSPEQINNAKMANAQAAAQVATACTFIAGQLVFGPDGQPVENEAQTMTQAYQTYFYMSEKPVNVPPWLLVGVVAGGYIARRMAMDVPRSRVMKGVEWIKQTFYKGYIWLLGG